MREEKENQNAKGINLGVGEQTKSRKSGKKDGRKDSKYYFCVTVTINNAVIPKQFLREQYCLSKIKSLKKH